jgi:hypothetical protein
VNKEKAVRYFQITPGTNSFLWEEIGKYEDAIQFADQVLAVNPAYSCSWLNKGKALLKPITPSPW